MSERDMEPREAFRIGLRLAVEMLDGKAKRILAANERRSRPLKRAAEDAQMLRSLADRLWELRERQPSEFRGGAPGHHEWSREWFGEEA